MLHSEGLIFDVMHVITENIVLFRLNGSYRLAYLRFVPGICCIWDGLGSVSSFYTFLIGSIVEYHVNQYVYVARNE